MSLILLMIISCRGDDNLINDGSDNTKDVAVTSNPSKVGVSYAQIDGYVNLNLITANYNKQELGIEFSMLEDFKHSGHATTKELTGNKLTVQIDTLTANTKYYYRTYVKLNEIVYYGEVRSFSTKDFDNITTTGDAINPTFTSVTLSAKVKELLEDSDEKYSIGIAYSTKSSYLNPDSIRFFSMQECPLSEVKDRTYSISLSRLSSGTTYYYCSYMKMGKKTKMGQVKSFITKNIDSGLVTNDASDITLTSAILNGTSSIANLYPLNYSIRYGFIYSTVESDLNYTDSNWSSCKKIDAKQDGNTLTAKVQSLQSETTYYYCVYATVDGITLMGQTKKFSTLSGKTTIQTNEASDITFNSAIVHGYTNLKNIYNEGTDQISYTFRYGTNREYLTQDNTYYYGERYSSVTPTLNNGSLSATIKYLSENTTYYYCLVARVDDVYIYGDVRSFKTLSLETSIEYLDVIELTINSAKLKAITKIADNDISYSFYCSKNQAELNRSTNYVNTSFEIVDNKTTIMADVENLEENTMYYYCLVVTLKNGQTLHSGTESFMTHRKSNYMKTYDATNITMTSATLGGWGNLETIYNFPVSYWVYFSEKSNMTPFISRACNKEGNDYYTEATNLSQNTVYYYCIAAKIDGKELRGDVKSFKTKSESDFFSTGDASNITLTTAKIKVNSSLSSIYPKATIKYRVQFSRNQGEVKSSSASSANIDNATMSTILQNLEMNTTYYYCCIANVDGTEIVGQIKSFKTLSTEGSVITGIATEITMTSAIINGSTTLPSISPNNMSIQYFVKYSKNNNLSSPSTKDLIVNGENMTSKLTGLSNNTTYYYCCCAIINGVEVNGGIKSFKTLSISGNIEIGTVTNITTSSATVNGTTTLPFDSSIKYQVKYSANSNLLGAKTAEVIQTGTTLTATLSNLYESTYYYFYFFTIIDGNTIESNIGQFQTNGHQIPSGFVDLGLSCKWASQNIGADSPSSYGMYYAWGEVESKSNFNSYNYKNASKNIGNDISGSEYDVAKSLGKGRIPTKDEFQELINECSWSSTTVGGTVGFIITGKNGNQIFLPSAGRKETAATYSGYCMYWTSTNGESENKAICIKDKTLTEYDKCMGLPIRPVE